MNGQILGLLLAFFWHLSNTQQILHCSVPNLHHADTLLYIFVHTRIAHRYLNSLPHVLRLQDASHAVNNFLIFLSLKWIKTSFDNVPLLLYVCV